MFLYLSESLEKELGTIDIKEVFIDAFDMDKSLYSNSRSGALQSFLIRKFGSSDEEQAYHIANEIYTAQRISQL